MTVGRLLGRPAVEYCGLRGIGRGCWAVETRLLECLGDDAVGARSSRAPRSTHCPWKGSDYKRGRAHGTGEHYKEGGGDHVRALSMTLPDSYSLPIG